LKLNRCGGRWARIVALAKESGRFNVIGAIEKADHPDAGKDAGLLAGIGSLDIAVNSAWPAKADVAIDFSMPEAANETLDKCSANSIPLVMGTTGLSDAQQGAITAAAREIPILYGTNMSVGITSCSRPSASRRHARGTDIDIEEHHRFKKDAPSGSALTLAQNICKATGRDYPGSLTHGRSGKDALRSKGTIGMHAVRAGDITGIHSVIYGTLGETITLNHTAHSRDTFVRGALRAAEWLIDKPPALYAMADVLGIK
jgi:4-hydroxy-tetrahydrodipicolinate reductase